MRERPLLFSGPMIRALLAGRKTITRRIVTVPWKGSRRALPYEPYFVESDGKLMVDDDAFDDGGGTGWREYAEYVGTYRPGDRLWVRETFAANVPGCEHQGGYAYRADHNDPRGDGPANPMRWTPSIFMPRKASRLTLQVTGVRVERLQQITEDGARAEGVPGDTVWGEWMAGRPSHKAAFVHLWDEINGHRAGWCDNPWVWVVEFQRLSGAQRGAA